MKYSGKTVSAFCCSLFCVWTAVSCIGVDYGYTNDGSGIPGGYGTSDLSIEFNWPGGAGDTGAGIPEKMTVIMAADVDEIHYRWNVGNDGMIPGAEAPVMPVIRHGDYYAAAFHADGDSFEFSGLDKFSSGSYPMSSVAASLPSVNDAALNMEFGVSGSEFGVEYAVVGNADRLWHAAGRLSSNSDNTPVLSFTPADLSIDLDFKLTLRLVAGARVSSVTAALAGVPASVSLMTGNASGNAVGKSVFKMDAVSASGESVTFSGKLRTLGAFSSSYGSYLAGSGIVWLAIDASAGSVQRRLYAGVNISSQINGQGIMEKNGDGYRLAKNHAVFNMGTLTLDGEKLVSGDNAVDKWK